MDIKEFAKDFTDEVKLTVEMTGTDYDHKKH